MPQEITISALCYFTLDNYPNTALYSAVTIALVNQVSDLISFRFLKSHLYPVAKAFPARIPCP